MFWREMMQNALYRTRFCPSRKGERGPSFDFAVSLYMLYEACILIVQRVGRE